MLFSLSIAWDTAVGIKDVEYANAGADIGNDEYNSSGVAYPLIHREDSVLRRFLGYDLDTYITAVHWYVHVQL